MADRTTTLATCWLITLADATVQGYTDHDTDLTVAAQLYTAAIGYLPSAVQSNVEMSPDNMDIQGIIDDAGIKESDLIAGRYDYAEILVFTVDYTDVASGAVQTLIKGKLGRVSISQGQFTAELNSLASQLSQNIGRTFSTLCDADLGDTRCGYTNTATGFTVTTVTDNRQFTATGRTEAADYWNGGLVTWATGAANSTYTMDIKTQATGGAFGLYEPMAFTIATGDTGTLTRGCDKTAATCLATFSNLDNFRGAPHIPGLQKLMMGPKS